MHDWTRRSWAVAIVAATLAAHAHAANFQVTSMASTAANPEVFPPGWLETFTDNTGADVNANFSLTNPGDFDTFTGPLFWTNETSATEPDDPNQQPATITLDIGGDGVGSVTLTGKTYGNGPVLWPSVPNPLFPLGPAFTPGEAGFAEWDQPGDGPQQVLVGDYLLEFSVAENFFYNTQMGLSRSGPAFGENATIRVELIEVVPEPATMALLGLGGLALVRRRLR